MFTRIIDFVRYRGHLIEVRVERTLGGEITCGFVAPGGADCQPVVGLGSFDNAGRALTAVKEWVADWAVRSYG